LNTRTSPALFYRCRSAVLGLYIEENQIIGSAFDQLIYTIDQRDGIINKKKYHRGPILCLSVDENYIVSGSEDKTIAIFDRRVLCDLNFYFHLQSISYQLNPYYATTCLM
jgi:WD40 repeat protein